MTLKTFGASEVVTSAEMNKATFQLPNSVIYGATPHGNLLASPSQTGELVASLQIDALLGRYLLTALELRCNTVASSVRALVQFYLPNGEQALVPGSRVTVPSSSTAFAETVVVSDLLSYLAGGDGLVDLRGAKVRADVTLIRDSGAGDAELKNLVIMGGGSSDQTDYGY